MNHSPLINISIRNVKMISIETFFNLQTTTQYCMICDYTFYNIVYSSVQSLSYVRLCDPMDCSRPSLPCPSPTPGVYSNSCPLSRWCHLILCCPLLHLPTIFPSNRVFSNASALHIRWPIIGVSASKSVLPVNTQDWFPLGWTGWISLQSKGLSRVFSNTTVQNHQFFGAQLSL